LIGAELHAPRTQVGNLWHIVAAGLPHDFDVSAPGETGPALAARAGGGRAFVVVAHPAYYGLTVADVETMPAAHALEIFNGASALAYEMGDSGHILDVLISAAAHRCLAQPTTPISLRSFRVPGPWARMGGGEGEKNDPEALVDALRAGHFYSSEGPKLLDVAIDRDEVIVSSSP